MKLIMVIVHTEDSNKLIDRLAKNKVRVTKLSSTGGFLRAGNCTLLIGTEEDKVEEIIAIIEEICHSRKETITTPAYGFNAGISMPMEVIVGGATIFVVDVDQFKKI
ncbi:MAG: cyclic-di-AMP receptor [Clostridia bacterium]|nr:cyclic-di-AMP receptor [Clostridia bacterium]